MGEEKFDVPGLGEDQQVTVGEKTTGEKAAENAPFYGSFMKAVEASSKTGETGGFASLASEGSALVGSLSEAGQIATDPIG